VHLWLEQPVAALALVLCDVHRGVGVADQLVGERRALADHHRDARAAAHGQLLVGRAHRRRERVDHALGGLDRFVAMLDVLQQQRELVTAEAGRRVTGADARGQALADLDQHLVAGGVAEAVVDDLEVVEVQEDHGHAAVLAPAASERMAYALDEQRAVGQARDRVVERLVGELLLERAALADVAAV
jgi:hypothetical protein